jgi:prevent-host-death family protein
VSWQIQEAKQRFSEVLRAVRADGPQTITWHGTEVAVIIDIEEYIRLTRPKRSATEILLGPPYFDDDIVSVLDGIEAERKEDFPREIDLGVSG